MTNRFWNPLLAVLLGGTACTTGGSMAKIATAPAPPGPTSAVAPAAGDGRVLVRSASLSVEVERIDPALAEITSFTARSGGYVESSMRHSEGSAHLVIRVPSATLDAALDSIGRVGRVKGRSIVATDVTTEAQDLDARVLSLRATRDRLRQLLERAASVADIAAVEAQLSRVQQDLDSLDGRLKALRTDVALSAVAVDLDRRHVLGPLGLVAAGLAWVVEKLFVLR